MPSSSAAVPFLGWRAQRRPRPGFAHVLGAAAGAFVVVAMVAFVAEIEPDDPRVVGTIFSAVLALAAVVGGFRGRGPLRSACVTILVLTVPLIWTFVLFGDGNGGRSDFRGLLLLTLLVYAALYLLTWTKGRAIFLAGALIVFSSWVVFEIAGDSSSSLESSVSGNVPSGSGPFSVTEPATSLGGGTDDTTTMAVLMVVGIVFLVVGGVLDQRRLAGAATPFIAVGAVNAIAGGVLLGATESTLAAGITAVLIGSAVGIVAAAGRDRRATTWIGVLTVFAGLVAILVDIAPDSEAGVGAIALGFAVALAAIAWWLAPVLHEPDDGSDTPSPPPTAPEGGDSARDPSAPVADVAAA